MGILSRQLRCNFYEIFKNVLCINRYDNEAFSWFLELGSCALQVIHGAITAGHSSTKWTICAILSAAYYIFSKSPAGTRWVKNVKVAIKFLKLMSGIKKYVNSPDLKNKALHNWLEPLQRCTVCFAFANKYLIQKPDIYRCIGSKQISYTETRHIPLYRLQT